MKKQMTFAQIGELYNQVSNELEGGVTTDNQRHIMNQVTTVQTQLQNLINLGTFNNDGGATITHVQNMADQMTILNTQIANFGQANYIPKFINDVVRDVQDIAAGDPVLNALAHQNNMSGFQQVSHLLAPPAPYPDSGLQTTTLLNFISTSNSLASQATALAGSDPNTVEVHNLISDIHTFTTTYDSYVTSQGGIFAARFTNEMSLNGVQGTASRELISGLESGNGSLVTGAAEVLTANAADVNANMLTTQNFVSPPNGGIPSFIDTIHVAGLVFNDAVTKLIGGVYTSSLSTDGTHTIPGNQLSVVNDLNATVTGLQNAIVDQHITGKALVSTNHVIELLKQESSLVAGVSTPQQASHNAAMINQDEAKILHIVNNNAVLASAAVGSDGTVGFAALPPVDTHHHIDHGYIV